jgi:sec-independent protein translocase protein TatB
MEILGIGAPELIFVIIIALIVLGPKDMQKAGRTIGAWLNQLVRSDGWKAFQQTSREIRNLPNNLMRQANVELAETEKELRKATDFRIPPASPSSRVQTQPKGTENSIQPAPATPPKTQGDSQPNAADGIQSNGVDNSTASKPPSANPPKAEADPEPSTEDNVGSNEAEGPTQSEPPSVNLPEPQSNSEPDAQGDVEKKPDVNTTDQDA